MLTERRIFYSRRHTGLLCVSCDIRPGPEKLINIFGEHLVRSLQIIQTQFLINITHIITLITVLRIHHSLEIDVFVLALALAIRFAWLGTPRETHTFPRPVIFIGSPMSLVM